MVPLKHIWLIGVHALVYGGMWWGIAPAFALAPLLLGVLLVWISCRDVAVMEVPDIAAGLLIASGVILAPDRMWAMGAVLLWAAIFLGISRGAKAWLGRDALGLGDVKLMAGIAAWIGPVAPIHVTLYASLAAIATLVAVLPLRGERVGELAGTGIAFGPFLCLSAWAIWLSGAAW